MRRVKCAPVIPGDLALTPPATPHPLFPYLPHPGTLRSNLDPWGAHPDQRLWEALQAAQLGGTVSALGGLDARMQVGARGCGGSLSCSECGDPAHSQVQPESSLCCLLLLLLLLAAGGG